MTRAKLLRRRTAKDTQKLVHILAVRHNRKQFVVFCCLGATVFALLLFTVGLELLAIEDGDGRSSAWLANANGPPMPGVLSMKEAQNVLFLNSDRFEWRLPGPGAASNDGFAGGLLRARSNQRYRASTNTAFAP